jgi:hypothetical protein
MRFEATEMALQVGTFNVGEFLLSIHTLDKEIVIYSHVHELPYDVLPPVIAV